MKLYKHENPNKQDADELGTDLIGAIWYNLTEGTGFKLIRIRENDELLLDWEEIGVQPAVIPSIRQFADEKSALEAGLLQGEMYYDNDGLVKVVLNKLEEESV